MHTILIADDDPDILELVRCTLEDPAYHLLAACNGLQVLELARAQRPALLVLDWIMPGLSGIDVLRTLRQHPTTAQLPVILLTGHIAETAHELGAMLHPTAYMAKPFRPLELRHTVHAMLAGAAPTAPR